MTVGERIKAARLWAGLTQRQLAEKLGLPYQRIGQYEKGIRNPKDDMLRRIEAAIGLPEFDLQFDPDQIKEYLENNPREYESISFDDSADNETKIMAWFSLLNADGQKEAIESVESLSKCVEFRHDQSPNIPDPQNEKKPASGEDGLSADAHELIDNYETLNQEGKDILLNTSRGLVAGGQYKKIQSVSAG